MPQILQWNIVNCISIGITHMADKIYVLLSRSRKRRLYQQPDGSWYYKERSDDIDLEPDDDVVNSEGENMRCRQCNHVKNGRSCRNCYLQKTYGITDEVYTQMWRAQSGKCQICRARFEDVSHGCVDHNHLTHRVRKLLCEACNLGLGNFKDRPDLLREAARYIERNPWAPETSQWSKNSRLWY